jgi:hypothetical protein
MARRSPSSWLPRLLFRFTFLLALVLISVVVLAPFFGDQKTAAGGPAKWIGLFSRDLALRRTAIASAIGLGVTASIFYRPQIRRRPAPPRAQPASSGSENIVGA